MKQARPALPSEDLRTCFQKIWDQHVIAHLDDKTDLLHIDKLLLHELTGSVTFQQIGELGVKAASPRDVFSIVDHLIATEPGRTPEQSHARSGSAMIGLARKTAQQHGFTFIGGGDPRQGISHVIGPELGIALPGLSIVCSDSHTSTLGGVGAMAWGIGSTECRHVIATQTLVQARPKTLRIVLEGHLAEGVATKDLALHLMGLIGAKGGDGFAIEYAGSLVRRMNIDERLTLCNMTIEMSAKYGMVAPDDVSFEYLAGREYAPKERAWDEALAHWRQLAGHAEARFDKECTVDVTALQPTITWGISPEHVVDIDGQVPDSPHPEHERARRYVGLEAGRRMASVPIDVAYVGSCTNGRLDDLRQAARVLAGRRLAPGVLGICVPGSGAVKRAAEREGIDLVFKSAGFEWHEPGCGHCAYLGNDRLRGARVISTTNRNFENRQGLGTRTHLASPATVAASAVRGCIADPRPMLLGG